MSNKRKKNTYTTARIIKQAKSRTRMIREISRLVPVRYVVNVQ